MATTTSKLSNNKLSVPEFYNLPVVKSEFMTLDYVIYYISIAMLCIWWFQWLMHITAIVYAWMKLHRKSSVPDDFDFPGVSILKPLTGIDKNLSSNLTSFFSLSYPKYELLFCIEDENDPAVILVENLKASFPHIDTRVFVGGVKKVGVNPKINNMMQGYANAKHPLILISDSGLQMRKDTLMEMVLCMKEGVGLVHQLPFVHDRSGFAAVLEKVHFGTQHSKIYLLADMVGVNCMTGMSCLFRKHVVESAGGLKSLAPYLAEDYYLSQIFFDKGWQVRVCSQPAIQNSGDYSVEYFQRRMIRWIKLRSSLVPYTIILEPISEWLFQGIGVSLAVSFLFQWSPLAFFLIHSLAWFILDYVLLRIVQGGPVPFSRKDFVVGWLFRELSSWVLMLRAHSIKTLTWRSRNYFIHSKAVGEEVKTSEKDSASPQVSKQPVRTSQPYDHTNKQFITLPQYCV